MKIDTGMTRLGCDLKEAKNLIEEIDKLPNIQLKGVYSHLAMADNFSSKVTQVFISASLKRFSTETSMNLEKCG